MTVYVCQRPMPNRRGWVPNLEPAITYGPLEFVFDGGANPYRTPNIGLDLALRKLTRFNPERDFLLWPNAGDPAASWCCILALTQLGVKSMSFLYWMAPSQSRSGYYSPVRFQLQ